jgi:hypothetical protein
LVEVEERVQLLIISGIDIGKRRRRRYNRIFGEGCHARSLVALPRDLSLIGELLLAEDEGRFARKTQRNEGLRKGRDAMQMTKVLIRGLEEKKG